MTFDIVPIWTGIAGLAVGWTLCYVWVYDHPERLIRKFNDVIERNKRKLALLKDDLISNRKPERKE